ncbi:hypothetical protein D3C80_2065040 [compost metagenome]
MRVGEVLRHQPVHVLGAGMDVGLGHPDIADIQLLAGGRHDLHDADRADMAARLLVQL